jgi:hypothetical protein
MEAITGPEQAASRGEEDGEARCPTVVVNFFFLPPFGRHNVPTKGVFFFFVPQMADIFSYPE